MLLSAWIEKNGGTLKTGNLLGVQRNVVYAWRRGGLPRAALMKTIVTKTKGRVSYADMIEGHLAKRTAAVKKTPKATKKTLKAVKGKPVAKKAKSKKIDPGF